MSRIDGFSTLLIQIRARLTERAGRKGAAASKTAPSAGNRSAAPPSIESLRLQIKGAIAGLDIQKPSDLALAKQRFVESILMAELGIAVAGDVRFMEIAQNVVATIDEDARLSKNLGAVLLELS